MKPYQERVIAEKIELDEKRNRLANFMGETVYLTLDAAEQDRLRCQLDAMTVYSKFLGQRIAAFDSVDGSTP
jgi:hypothetical protein